MRKLSRYFFINLSLLAIAMILGLSTAKAQDSRLEELIKSGDIQIQLPIQNQLNGNIIHRPLPGDLVGICGNGKLEVGEECEAEELSDVQKPYCNENCEWEFPDGMEECVDEQRAQCKEEVELFLEENGHNLESREERVDLRKEGEKKYQECLDDAYRFCMPQEEPKEPEDGQGFQAPEGDTKVQQEPEVLGALSGSGCSLALAGTSASMPAWLFGLFLALAPVFKRRSR